MVMRGIGLIVAGSLVAACGGPGTDASSNSEAESREVVGQDQPIINGQVEPRQAPEVANTGDNVQAESASPCLMQGADRLQVVPLRAVGTEPFWGARVEGRCVTYITPENQQGVRIWTRYFNEGNGRSAWVGQLGGKKFEMRVRPEASCSDGMSDKRYPIAVELTVMGESRKGCAEPL
jgi:uncharacterized membrane protein